MKPPRRRKFKQQIKQQLLSLPIELDIKLTVRPKEPQFWQTFRTEHWFNHKCKEYYSPGKVQMMILRPWSPREGPGGEAEQDHDLSGISLDRSTIISV
jgi:hypothetical protein